MIQPASFNWTSRIVKWWLQVNGLKTSADGGSSGIS